MRLLHDWVFRAFLWALGRLMRPVEHDPLTCPECTRLPPPPDRVWRRIEQRLELDRLSQADGWLAYALGSSPTPYFRLMDTRWRQ